MTLDVQMARRNIFQNLNAPQSGVAERKTTPGYGAHGASRNMMSSIGELAEKAAYAETLIKNGVVIELDPELVDVSFISDRLSENDEAFERLVEAIRENGQNTPILVRPHPEKRNRYQVVFGHRRLRVAKILNRPVRAVVRSISDTEHVIAQGQENSARENLSFIERAVFAKKLQEHDYERITIQAALTIDGPMLTRMLFVSNRVPYSIIQAIGPAKSIGRDRWLIFAQLTEVPQNCEMIKKHLSDEAFLEKTSEERFEFLLNIFNQSTLAKRKKAKLKSKKSWVSADKKVSIETSRSTRSVSFVLKEESAKKFAQYIETNFEALYEQFKSIEIKEGL